MHFLSGNTAGTPSYQHSVKSQAQTHVQCTSLGQGQAIPTSLSQVQNISKSCNLGVLINLLLNSCQIYRSQYHSQPALENPLPTVFPVPGLRGSASVKLLLHPSSYLDPEVTLQLRTDSSILVWQSRSAAHIPFLGFVINLVSLPEMSLCNHERWRWSTPSWWHLLGFAWLTLACSCTSVSQVETAWSLSSSHSVLWPGYATDSTKSWDKHLAATSPASHPKKHIRPKAIT